MGVASFWFWILTAGAALLFYRVRPSHRWVVILLTNLIFFSCIQPEGLPLLGGLSLVAWGAALGIRRGSHRKVWLTGGILLILSALILDKYWHSMAQSLNLALHTRLWSAEGLLVTMGVSYFTLQLISYLVDVYRGIIPAEENPLRVFCFASFFLSITQGPFQRYGKLMPQLEQECVWDWNRGLSGVQRIGWGCFLKFAIAQRLATPVELAFLRYETATSVQLVLSVILYSILLYADFAGYSHIVLGVGELFGLELPENFYQPYFAVSCQDLWRRWHMSLSAWLRDYVYIPLGGGHCSPLRKNLNLVIAFGISGLWHGVGLNYLIWGLLNGIYQVVGSLRRKLFTMPRVPYLSRVLQSIGTYLLFDFALVFFRSPDLSTAFSILSSIARLDKVQLYQIQQLFVNRIDILYLVWGMLIVLTVDLLHENGHHLRAEINALHPVPKMAIHLVLFLSLALMGVFISDGSTFLYARF